MRPDFQAPRLGKAAPKGEQVEADLVPGIAKAAKPRFPRDPLEQTHTVMAALAEAEGPVDAASIAARFSQGQRVRERIAAILVAGARIGSLSHREGSERYFLRRHA